MNEYIIDNPLPGSITIDGGYLKRKGLCLTQDGDSVSMQECIPFVDADGLDNVDPIKSQTWIIDPKGVDYTVAPEELPGDFAETEFIIRATCSELVLSHFENP